MERIQLGGLVFAIVVGCCACAAGGGDDAVDDEDSGAGAAGGAGLAGAGAGGAGVTGGTGGGAVGCEYPPGESGVLQGSLVDGTLAWQGFAAGSDTPVDVAMADYHDCDGSRGIHALLVIQSATWCGPCQADAAKLEQSMQSGWAALGIHVLTLMVEDGNSQPATVQTASQWKSSFGLDSVAVAADPDFSFRYFNLEQHIDEAVFPTQLVIDPRTMIIEVRDITDADIAPQLEALATANQ